MLADATPPAKRRGLDCSVGTALTTLPESEATALRSMLANRQAWTDRAIFEACRAEGYAVGAQTVGRHRRGECRCFL